MQIRYAACLSVVSGHTSVSEAARRLGMSRNRFQSILHRGLGAMVEAIAPQPPGRPAKSAREVELEEEVEELRRQLHHLQVHAELTERLLATVSEAMKRRVMPRARATATRGAKKTTGGADDEPAALLRVVVDFRGKLPLAEVSAVMGRSPSTCRRWVDRAREGQPLRARRGPKPVPKEASAVATAHARELVRETHGLVGAAALAKATGLSRREAAAVKHDTCTLVEHERKVESARVRVVYPGLIRAFDAMHLRDCEGKTYLLCAGDAAVPYRTTLYLADAYDSEAVCAALQADFEAYGPPLVLRMDRASAPWPRCLTAGACWSWTDRPTIRASTDSSSARTGSTGPGFGTSTSSSWAATNSCVCSSGCGTH
jgi:transposase-like protein